MVNVCSKHSTNMDYHLTEVHVVITSQLAHHDYGLFLDWLYKSLLFHFGNSIMNFKWYVFSH